MKEKVITLNKSLLTVLCSIFFIFIAFNTNVFAADSDIVDIPEAELREVLNENLGVANTTAAITKGQLATIKYLTLNGKKNITDISALKYCINLEQLNIINCDEIVDISPIKNLKNLVFLEIEFCDKITDMSTLKNLTQLERLYLSQNMTDISALSNLTNLKKLNMSHCYFLTDISALSNLTNLEDLSMYNCSIIADISPIKNLKNLVYLKINNCSKISNISALSNLTNLRNLEINYCPEISDISALSNLTNLRNLNIRGDYNITDISVLKNLTKLEYLYMQRNEHITDISILKNLINLKELYIFEFTNITDISVLKNLTNLTDLALSSCTKITDISALKNLTKLEYLGISDIKLSEKNNVSYKETISSLINLRTLYIEGANISNEHTSMFKNLTKLEKLYMSKNHITDYSFITSLKNLKQINFVTNTVNNSELNLYIFDTVSKYKIKNDVKDANGNYVKPVPSAYYDYNETTNEIIVHIDKIKDNQIFVKYEFDIQNITNSKIYVNKDISLLKFTPSLVVNGSTSMLNKIKGDDIKLEVKLPSNDANNYTYKFAVLNEENNKWSVLRNFDKNSTLNYNLGYTGTKIFAVTVMDNQNNKISTNRLKVNVYEPLVSKLTVNNSSNNIAKVIGSKITLNAKGFGGSGNYTYKFAVYNMKTCKWSVLTDYTKSSTYTYSLDYEGEKRFAVTIKDSVGNLKMTNYIYVDVYKPLKGNLKVNDSKEAFTVIKGDKINLVATGYYGSEKYAYRFAVYNEDTNKWSLLRDFNSNNTLEYALNYTGKKVFAVTIKDSYGNSIATNRIQVTVYEPLESKLTIDNSTDKLAKVVGSKIILNAKGYGGSGNYTYKYAVYNMKTCKWSVLTDYIKSSTYTYSLDYEGEKRFAVTIKDSVGNLKMTNYIYVDVYKPLKGNLKVNDSKDPITAKIGTKINLVATGYYGSEKYTYKFSVYNEVSGKWSVLRDFNSKNTLEYALDYPGKKIFAVTIKDSFGNTVSTNRLEVNVKN